VHVAINLIADPDWDHERFRVLREWCLEQPEIVNISVNTPYPGTESWLTEERRLETRDYRLFDIQHAVLPTRLPLNEFYEELVATQRAIYAKHIDWRDIRGVAGIATRLLLRGQTNFVKSLFKLRHTNRLAGARSTSMRRAVAPAARSTPRPSNLSTKPGWARRLNYRDYLPRRTQWIRAKVHWGRDGVLAPSRSLRIHCARRAKDFLSVISVPPW
jgi:hypothetical protein